MIYGIVPLDVTNDHWIYNGYVEQDVIQHYAGWMAFRQSAWSIPLGMIDGLGGTALTFTDSIPWASILIKLFRPILPKVFQYFGWYILVCFILQATASGLMVKLATGNEILSYLGAVFFTTAPIMLERAFRHTALASHWLVTFSIYLYLISRKNRRVDWRYILLSVLAIGVHPYFLPMVFGIFAAAWAENSLKRKEMFPYNTVILAAGFVLTIGAGYLIGALGISSDLGGDGFGYYSMNLNAPVNPISAGGIRWSSMLPVLPQALGNYDGFNYLGVGGILLIAVGTAVLIAKREFLTRIRENIWPLLLCTGLFVFAVSNVITLNGNIILEYPLPDAVLKFAAIFRASSRMFYPVYYFLFLAGIYGVSRMEMTRARIVILVLLVCQVVDIAPGLASKHQSFDAEAIEDRYSQLPFSGEAWQELAAKCSDVKLLNWMRNYSLAAFCAGNGWSPEMTISAHIPALDDLDAAYARNLDELMDGAPASNVYLTNDTNMVPALLQSNWDLHVYYLDGYYAVLSGDTVLDASAPVNAEEFPLCAADLTDDNWEHGISRWNENQVILFQYSSILWRLLNESESVIVGADEYVIEDVVQSGSWIHVYVNKDASACQAPAALSLKSFTIEEFPLCAADLTDDNWERGVSRWNENQVILFQYSSILWRFFGESESVIAGADEYVIEDVVRSGSWIHVYVNKDASACQAPAALGLK